MIAPGGCWRELDYGGAGWLTRRTVQTGANESETTTYAYDSWGRLRLIDYPRSADVQMGYDGESRRVWVQDGVGRREYTYDAWGRVTRQQGCCGSEPGIEVVAVSAEYDAAGRKLYETERRADDSAVRTIQTDYDPLGRIVAIGDYDGAPPARNQTPDFRRRVVYFYSEATGRLHREVYSNGTYVEYTYYGADVPKQRGFVRKVEHRKQDGTLLIGYEYTYDLLGRVVQSVERPSGDTTTYAYTPAGRLESEKRTGQVEYARQYAYNPDGSRQSVYRDDPLNGTHHEFYEYDPVSGRLVAVEDRVNSPPYPRHEFVWNPEGTLARWWSSEPNSYARVFSYDEEGRLTKIARDYGNGNLQVAYEYGYNSDGVKVVERRYRTAQHWLEYRFIGCGAGCRGNLLGLYAREYISGQNTAWRRVEEYVNAPTALLYGVPTDAATPVAFVLHPMVNGYVVHYPDGQMVSPYYTDSGGMQVGGYTLPMCAEKRDRAAGCVPYPVVPNPELPYPYEPPGVGLGDGPCGGKGSPSPEPDWCEKNKQDPSPVNCQDCCDQKFIQSIKNLPKEVCKKFLECVKNSCGGLDRDARIECVKGCLTEALGVWRAAPYNIKLKQYLECCYLACDVNDGKFDPPGHCKKFLPK